MSRVPEFKEGDDVNVWHAAMKVLQEQLVREFVEILSQSASSAEALPRFQAILADCNGPENVQDRLVIRSKAGNLVFENPDSGDYRILVRRRDRTWWIEDAGDPPATGLHETIAEELLWLVWYGNADEISMMASIEQSVSQD